MMAKKTKRNANTKSRNQKSRKQVIVPSVGIGISDGAETAGSEVFLLDSRMHTVDEIAPLPNPHISSNPAAFFTTISSESCADSMLVLPETKKGPEAANVCRAERVPNSQIRKVSRSTKHTVCDPWTQAIGPTTYIIHSSQENCFDTGVISPMCVKKKMIRRTQMNNNIQKTSRRKSLNSNKKLPLTKIKESYNLEEQPCETKNSITLTVNQDVENFYSNKNCASIEVSRDTILSDESIPFEASSDFWDSFLIDTYHQIASNDPDMPDFDPIPYPVLARGISVDPKNSPRFLQLTESNDASLVYAHGNDAVPTSAVAVQKIQGQSIQTEKVVQIPNDVFAGKSCAKIDISEPHQYVDVQNTRHDNEHSKDSTSIVGPESWQMDVINRMLFYLDCETNCPYSIYRFQFRSIVEQCTNLHVQGIQKKFRHLPGAIFEQMIDVVGGSIFLSIYNAAKRLQYGRLNSGVGVETEIYAGQPFTSPSVMQLAVGYGYCMAQSSTFKERMICPDLIKTRGIKYIAEVGAQTVLNMSEETRSSFWSECILKNGNSTIMDLSGPCAYIDVDNARDNEHSKDSTSIVGPESWQMDVINRMLFYLDCETNCPYSMYMLQFRSIVEHCTKLHIQGTKKFHHLPGAVFEQTINAVGGSIFLSIYKDAKRLQYGRLNSGAGVESGTPSTQPELLQLAVGYGYCLAQSSTFKGRKNFPDRVKAQGIKYVAEIGAQALLNMSNETRLSFWSECVLKNGERK